MNKPDYIKLGDLVEFQRGYDLPQVNFRQGVYPVAASNGTIGFHDEYRVEGPGITIGRSGTVGQPHYIETNFFPHNTSLYVKDFKGNDAKYVFYLLRHLGLGKQKTGSSVPTMNRNHLHPMKIWAHVDTQDQKKIAAVLSSLDAKIELNNRINRELEALAKTIYDSWFVQFDFPDQNGKPYRSTGGRTTYDETLKRNIPECWEVKTLGDIATVVQGQSPKGETYNELGSGTLFYQGSTDFGERFPTPRQYTTAPTRFAKKDDILLSVRAPVGTMNIANETCCIGRGLAALSSQYFCFIYGVVKDFKVVFDRRNSDGTTFGAINKDDISSLRIAVPKDRTLLDEYQVLVEPSWRKQDIVGSENRELTRLRDWLLPMLMNGQVTVK